MHPWEIHPKLVMFPIAFLLGGVVLDVYGAARGQAHLRRVAVGLMTAGFWLGVVAAAAGVLAYFTVQVHTEEAHKLMFWHIGGASVSLVIFAWIVGARRPSRMVEPRPLHTVVAVVGGLVIAATGHLGGWM